MRKTLSPRGVYERQISEEDIVKQITQFLELNGARVHRIVERIPWGRKTSTPGMPDIYGYFFRDPRDPKLRRYFHFWIEVKKPGGRRRPAQIKWIHQAQEDGVIAFFAESVEDVVREFGNVAIKLRGL